MKILTIACFFAILLTYTLECDGKIRVLIGSLVKKGNGYSTRGMELAEEAAKNSTHLKAFMGEYDVTIQKQETHGTRSFAVQWAAFWFFCSEEKPLLLLGPETSKEVLSVLDITSSETKMTVAYLTAFPPNVRYGESLASTTAAFNKAKMKMMEHFGWNRAAVVYDFADNDGLYVETVVNLAKFAKFDLIGIEAINTNTELVTKSLSADTKAKLSKLKDQDTKIFFGEFGKTGASLVFCQIFKLKLFGPGFVWIIHSNAGTIEEWVDKSIKIKEKTGNNTETCTEEEYKQAAEGTFIFDKISFRRDVDTPTSSGLTVNQVFSRSTFKDIDPSDKIQVTTAFDAAWAVFLAMNETSAALTKSNLTLATNITRTNSQKRLITNTLRDALKNLNFEGLTGPVSFNEDSERQGVLVLNQMRDSGKKMVQVGQYFAKADKLQLYNDTRKTIFKDGRTPQDASQKEHEMIEVSPALFVVFCTASSIGIVLGILFLVFNRYYRNYKFIRLSAPLFNDIIVLGCIMCLATVILFGLRNVDDPITMMPRICKARAWILTIGFTLAFGAMFIKTWRIYKICTNKRLKVRLGPLSDWWMLAMVGGVILVDALLLIAWEVVDPLQRDIYEFEPKTDPDKPYVIIIPAINTCTANNLTVWLTLLYVYKGILLLYGLFLAYETRNVVYAHLNDSRVIGICVYNTVVLSTIGAFLALILTDQQYEQLYAALSVCITFPATATISLIFIPKLVHRIKSNNLEDETGPTTMDQTARPSIDISTTMNYQTEMARDRFVDAASTNTLCVVNGEPSLSPAPSPSPPVKAVNDHVNVAVSLED